MKIAVLSAYYGTNVGGAEVSTKIYVDELSKISKKNISLSVITANQNAQPQAGLQIYKIPLLKHYPHSFLVFDLRMVDHIVYLQIRKILQKIDPDILHIQEFELSYPALKAAKSLGIKTLITVRDHRFICNLPMFNEHGEPVKNYTRSQYISKLKELAKQLYSIKSLAYLLYPFLKDKPKRFKHVLNNADAIVCVSRYMADLVKKSGIKNDIYAAYNLAPKINVHQNKNVPKEVSKKMQKMFVIFAPGRLEHYKGFHVLIKAFSEIIKGDEAYNKNPSVDNANKHNITNFRNIKLIIAGTGTYESELKKLACRLNLNHRIEFHGKIPLSKVYENYSKCDAVVSPSLWAEPISRILWEAFAFGKPIITTSTGGTPEIIKNRKTGLLVKPNDTKQLKDAILLLMHNSKLRNNIISNAYRFIKSHNKKQLDLYIRLYTKIIKNGK